MDRISGVMPQIGWSPVLMPVAPERAPASTVEPASPGARSGGSAGAQTGARDDHERAREAATLLRLQSAGFWQTGAEQAIRAQALPAQDSPGADPGALGGAQAGAAHTAAGGSAQGDGARSFQAAPPPDPNAPSGPPPTFDVSPLEARAAALTAIPAALPRQGIWEGASAPSSLAGAETADLTAAAAPRSAVSGTGAGPDGPSLAPQAPNMHPPAAEAAPGMAATRHSDDADQNGRRALNLAPAQTGVPSGWSAPQATGAPNLDLLR